MAPRSVEDYRLQLVEAAMRVISRDGVAQATTRRIAAEAGVSTASLHYSFRDKEELFAEVIGHCQQLTLTRFRERHPAGGDVGHAVRTLLSMFREWARAGAEFHLAQYELFFWGRRATPTHSFSADIYNGYIALCEQIIAKALPAGDRGRAGRLAADVMAVTDGLVLQALAFGEDGSGEETIERYSRMILFETNVGADQTSRS
jgi:AcrR family transcriptional regulator